MEELEKLYVPVYVIDKEIKDEPWHQLYVTRDCFGHMEGKWVINEDGDIVCSDILSPFLEDPLSYDGQVIRKPLILDHFTKNPAELQRLAEKLIL